MDWKTWFLDSDYGMEALGPHDYQKNFSIEELYQAFKARMKEEALQELDDKAIRDMEANIQRAMTDGEKLAEFDRKFWDKIDKSS